MLFFVEKEVDCAVIESGIGALTDATNQHAHCLSILTNIEAEHLDIFGSLKNLASEKSGVMRENIPLILGNLPKEVEQLILDKAAELNVPVVRFKNHYIVNNSGFYLMNIGSQVWIADSKTKAKNAWIALQAFKSLGGNLTDEEKVKILKKTNLPAREEIVSKSPFVIIDSAHTQSSAENLANYIEKSTIPLIRKTILLVSFSAKKNISAVLKAFPHVDKIVITQATESRSLLPEEIQAYVESATFFTKNPKIRVIENPLTALEKIMSTIEKDDALVITGSVYLAGLLSQQFR